MEQLLALQTPILALYKVVNAGAGKHVYDVTYWELANHQSVSRPVPLLRLIRQVCVCNRQVLIAIS